MKALLLILAGVLTIQSQRALAQTDACGLLRQLLLDGTPNYSELANLKELCQAQMTEGSNVIFRKSLRKVNFPLALQDAQERRVRDHISISNEIREVMRPFTDRSKQSELIHTKDVFFVSILSSLKNTRNNFNDLKDLGIDKYFDSETRDILNTIHMLPAYELSIDALSILSDIDLQQESFQNRADTDIARIDSQIQKYIDSSERIVSAFQFQANFNSSQDMIKDFQQAISPSVLKLQATITWGKFLAKSNINSILLKSDLDFHTGFVQSGQEKLKLADQMIEDFLSRLPSKLAQQIRESDPFKNTKLQNEARQNNFNGITGNQIDERQNEYVEYQYKLFNEVKTQCIAKYPAFSDKLKQLELDYLGNREGKVPALQDQDVHRFLLESLGNRFDIYLDLCKEFAK